MSGDPEGEVWLVRHGETEWSRDSLHTSHTDLPLTEKGEDAARALHARLEGVSFDRVLSSPRQRALRTAELAGFDDVEREPDVVEWDYGDYEGVSTAQIRETVPGWTVWTHDTPGGERPADVTERLDRLVARLREGDQKVLVFAHGHSLRALAARWVGEPVTHGQVFKLDTATVSVLGWERDVPVVQQWNAPV